MDNDTAQIPSVAQLIKKYTYWGEHEKFTLQDWKYLIDNNDTRMGYWHWVHSELITEHNATES